MRKVLGSVAVGALVLGWSVIPAWAAPGDLDPAFSGNGKVTTRFPHGPGGGEAVVVQPDGRIVTVGTVPDDSTGTTQFALVRFRANGERDRSFGGNGRLTTRFPSGLSSASALALQADGRIIAAGYVVKRHVRFALTRYLPDGTLDDIWGGDGRVITDFPSESQAYAVAVRPDGKVVAAGQTFDCEGGESRWALARYRPNGELDPTFDDDGLVTGGFCSERLRVMAIALQPDGKIVAVGGYVARFLPDGTLDKTFGEGGLASAAATDVVVQPDGMIVVGGTAVRETKDGGRRPCFVLTRFDASGTRDLEFGDGGSTFTAFDRWAELRGLTIQDDGSLVAVGTTRVETFDPARVFALARYDSTGALDPTFGGDGRVLTSFEGLRPYANDVAMSPGGKIVVAGRATGRFAVARYLP